MHAHTTRQILPALFVVLGLSACGGGGDAPAPTPPAPPSTYTIGGTLTGLDASNKVVLQNNAGDDLTLTANGGFNFATKVTGGDAYAVTVKTQPSWQWCTASSASGTATADVTSVSVNCSAAVGQVSTFAGSGIASWADATGTAANFNNPYGITLDSSGNAYIGDYNTSRVRKITSSGAVTTLAGSGAFGWLDGTGAAAIFSGPKGVVADASGNVYVADSGNNRIRKVTAAGVVTTLAGSGTAAWADGTGAGASFFTPTGIALDSSGNLYVADLNNHRIRKVTAAGVVTTLAGSSIAAWTDGTGAAANFYWPTALAVDGAGNVYVADAGNHRIRKVTSAGVVTTVAGSGTAAWADGTGAAASFNSPGGVVLDSTNGNLFVTDSFNNRIRKVTAAGVVSTVAGTATAAWADGKGAAASFNEPRGITLDSNGTLYVVDYGNHRIRKLAPVAP